MRGWRIASSACRSGGFAKIRSRRVARSSSPFGVRMGGAEVIGQGLQAFAAGKNDLAGEQIGVDDGGAVRGEAVGDEGLAAGDAAGEADEVHGGIVRERRRV